MIESTPNTFHLLRINCSSGIIRSLKWIFDLGNNREKVVFEYMKFSTKSTKTDTLHHEGDTYKQAV